ncbi:MAG TPA: cupredoxin domain-containing protein [Verrucomicrobiae bacterium]|nr:cupredoxin domain-containing protein [Verrucomicrobiae bacterium]
MRVALRLAIPTLIAGVTLVACASTAGSGSTTAPATSAAPAAGKTAALQIKGFAFSPATLTVDKGTAVTITNNDSTTHTFTSGANRTKDGTFDQQISGGTEGSVTFDTAGTFEYFCQIHSSMKGSVVVK